MSTSPFYLRIHLEEHVHHSHGRSLGVSTIGFYKHPRWLCEHANFDSPDDVYLVA